MAKLDKSALAGALMLGAMSGEALAEDKSTAPFQLVAATSQQVDCKVLARNYEGSGKEKMQVYSDCRNGVLDERIEEQQRLLVALNKILAKEQMRIDELGYIRDANNEKMARIVTVNGKYLIRRQKAEQRTAKILDEAERYILENS